MMELINLVESSKEGYGSKMTVLQVMLMTMMMILQECSFQCVSSTWHFNRGSYATE
jgi:hypothetical protein